VVSDDFSGYNILNKITKAQWRLMFYLGNVFKERVNVNHDAQKLFENIIIYKEMKI